MKYIDKSMAIYKCQQILKRNDEKRKSISTEDYISLYKNSQIYLRIIKLINKIKQL